MLTNVLVPEAAHNSLAVFIWSYNLCAKNLSTGTWRVGVLTHNKGANLIPNMYFSYLGYISSSTSYLFHPKIFKQLAYTRDLDLYVYTNL